MEELDSRVEEFESLVEEFESSGGISGRGVKEYSRRVDGFVLLDHRTTVPLALIGSMSPWVLPERTLGTVRYIETYPGNYLICRTVPCLLSTVP